MYQQGMSPRIVTVQQMASLLATQYTGFAILQPIGERWAYNFIKHHDDLRSKYNRRYDYQWSKCEDPTLIRNWFKRFHDIILQYGILNEDIYNFDETGFQMEVISTAKVVTGTDRAGRPRTIQSGNHE